VRMTTSAAHGAGGAARGARPASSASDEGGVVTVSAKTRGKNDGRARGAEPPPPLRIAPTRGGGGGVGVAGASPLQQDEDENALRAALDHGQPPKTADSSAVHTQDPTHYDNKRGHSEFDF
jgi:hypothetical protein